MAAATASRYKSQSYVHKMLDENNANIIMYFVHGIMTATPAVVPKNNIVIQTGRGPSFACMIKVSSDPEILKRFLEDRTRTFDTLMGAVKQISILNFFTYHVEHENTQEKIISLETSDLEQSKEGIKWGVYVIDQITNELVLQDELTHFLIEKTESVAGGITQTNMIKHTNTIMKDKPTNIHIFVNCASIPKESIRISNLHKFSAPLASHTVVTRSSTKKLGGPSTKNYTTKNIETAKYFKTEMVKLIAAKLTEKIQSAHRFDSKMMREKESVIQAKAAELYDTLLTKAIFEGIVKEYLETENEEAYDKFLENAFVGISQLVYDDISWLGIVVKRSGGGSAAKASKNKNTRKNTETLKDFKTEMVKRLAVNLTEKIQSAYGYDSKMMLEKKSVIQAKAAELYDALLTKKEFDYLVKEYLETKNEKVYDKFLASAYTTIHQLLFEDISWFEDAIVVNGPSVGGGSAKKTRRCRRSRINRK